MGGRARREGSLPGDTGGFVISVIVPYQLIEVEAE
jgi:hypothetical protein